MRPNQKKKKQLIQWLLEAKVREALEQKHKETIEKTFRSSIQIQEISGNGWEALMLESKTGK